MPNVLSFDLAGSGGVDLSLLLKRPGPALSTEPARWGSELSALPSADPLPPYVRLIHDVLAGDRSLFTRPDGLASGWKAVTPILDHPPKPLSYAPGSWGPAKARKLAAPGRWLLGG
jgi:glucose-6-phosphate 1-dehydrogenase